MTLKRLIICEQRKFKEEMTFENYNQMKRRGPIKGLKNKLMIFIHCRF